MSRGYGKYRRGGGPHSGFHFDSLFKENTNKPSAARSAASVGKWGITSFTSIRTLNGVPRSENASTAASTPTPDAPPKPKKFFKSRNTDPPEDPQPTNKTPPTKRSRVAREPAEKTREQPTRKFFSSKGSSASSTVLSQQDKKTVLTSNVNKREKEKPSEPSKPPIVLRICRGKSQLLNDSDESESTPTPSSTPTSSNATSPRAAKDTVRPANCRITRSARRSMQQDNPGSSPATADTPGEFSLFLSPRETEPGYSPQYIPAEKYELERKAMYDNLLRPNSPSREGRASCEEMKKEEETEEQFEKVEEDNGVSTEETEMENEEEHKRSEVDDNMEIEEPMDPKPIIDRTKNKIKDDEIEEEQPKESEPEPTSLPLEEQQAEVDTSEELSKEDENVTSAVSEEPQNAKDLIQEDWSSDSDSNSTMPETEAKSVPEVEEYTVNKLEENKDKLLDKILEPPSSTGNQLDGVAVPPPPVKLVISKKKGCIFKSRSKEVEGDGTGSTGVVGGRKRRAVYRHKWTTDDKETEKELNKDAGEEESGGNGQKATEGEIDDDFGFKDDPLERVTKDKGDVEVTSVRCTRNDKGYYTVVRNVKKAHQIQEIGEFQEFNDDVEYILDALQDNNPISTRCLSAITLASKCMAPAFRMHVRAHGIVAKFFKALHDATKDQSLGLCTATVMFVLSQDRLNMDLDRDCLELMLGLLESDVSYQQALDVCGLSTTQLEKNKRKVRELCAEIQSRGHAVHLNLESITVGQLAMETLLSLTSKRAGEWFKEELRELGGLEHIMKTVHECCRQVSDYVVTWTDTLLDKLKKVDRCLRVLENVTHNNEENQTYILKYNDGAILDTLVNLYKLCDGEIPLYPVTDISDKTSTGTIIREALLVTLKVLINLTHHFNNQSFGSELIGCRPGVIETSLHLLLQVPNYIPEQKKFELGMLVLMLLINLIQDQERNKKLLMEAKAPSKLESIYSREESAIEALIAQFYNWEGCAKLAEKKTNAILDGEKDAEEDSSSCTAKSTEEFIEDTVAKLLQKAGTHMEYTFLASYIGMLVGFLIMENPERQSFVRQFLRGSNFVDMVELLKKFFNFMNLTASTEASSVCAIKATEKVIKFLEECDKPIPGEQVPAEPFEKTASNFSDNTGIDLSYRLVP